MKKLPVLLILVLISFNAVAQKFRLEYDHTALLVTDLEQSADFYSRLGLGEIPVPYENPVLR